MDGMESWDFSTVVACLANWRLALTPDVRPRATSPPAPVLCAEEQRCGRSRVEALPCNTFPAWLRRRCIKEQQRKWKTSVVQLIQSMLIAALIGGACAGSKAAAGHHEALMHIFQCPSQAAHCLQPSAHSGSCPRLLFPAPPPSIGVFFQIGTTQTSVAKRLPVLFFCTINQVGQRSSILQHLLRQDPPRTAAADHVASPCTLADSQMLSYPPSQGVFGALAVINSFPGERALVLRERASGM